MKPASQNFTMSCKVCGAGHGVTLHSMADGSYRCGEHYVEPTDALGIFPDPDASFAAAVETGKTLIAMELQVQAAMACFASLIAKNDNGAAMAGHAWAHADAFVNQMPPKVLEALGTARAVEMMAEDDADA